jgi:ribosomal protein S18 acetylase RimI-like enzyme
MGPCSSSGITLNGLPPRPPWPVPRSTAIETSRGSFTPSRRGATRASWSDCQRPQRVAGSTRWLRAIRNTVGGWRSGSLLLRHLTTSQRCSRQGSCVVVSTSPPCCATSPDSIRAPERVAGLEIRRVERIDEFERIPHPAIGPLTTPLRRAALQRIAALIGARPARSVMSVAWSNGQPVGSSELFLGAECAGLHSLTVPEQYRHRGIGTALVEHACAEAVRRGASTIVLLASSDGRPLYERCGFGEVARFGYWYRSFQRF